MYILKYFYLTWCIFFNQPEVTFRTALVFQALKKDIAVKTAKAIELQAEVNEAKGQLRACRDTRNDTSDATCWQNADTRHSHEIHNTHLAAEEWIPTQTLSLDEEIVRNLRY